MLILLFFAIILTILNISLKSQNNFSRLVCFGIGFNFFLYLAVNLGMVTGLIPVVGVPLPIISYGGTAMLTTMFALGLVMSAKIHKDHNL
jgi:rod shape determining protein RodA